jgi:RNA polymerase sigma-70 factor (ECF subfamily)
MNVSIKTVEGQLTKAYKILRDKLNAKMKTIFFLLFGFNLKKIYDLTKVSELLTHSKSAN